MRRRFHLLLLVLVVLPLIALSRWGGEGKSPWSPAQDGVQVRVVTERAVWRAGRPLEVSLRMRSADGKEHSTPGIVHGTVSHVLEGKGFLEETRDFVLAPPPSDAVVPAAKTADFPLLTIPAEHVTPGVHEFSGTLGPFALPPLKVRVLKPRS